MGVSLALPFCESVPPEFFLIVPPLLSPPCDVMATAAESVTSTERKPRAVGSIRADDGGICGGAYCSSTEGKRKLKYLLLKVKRVLMISSLMNSNDFFFKTKSRNHAIF